MNLDYEHVINKKINGCDISIYFQKSTIQKLKR
nr:MAG TPA: hypothetical protein [Caudoviricetes sp.]